MQSDQTSGMDVDPTPIPSTSVVSMQRSIKCSPKIEENALVPTPTKVHIMEVLDRVEDKVEKLRKEAYRLEAEKDHLLATLDSIRLVPAMNEMDELDCEEAGKYLERIVDRCLTVEVKVHTIRDQTQEEALHQVNEFIDALVIEMRTDPDLARQQCVGYMNACASQVVHGITDKKFESTLLGCTIDDQKRVKKRLCGLLKYLDKFNQPSEVD